MTSKSIASELPFVWPGPAFNAEPGLYSPKLSFEGALDQAISAFGVVSAVDSHAIDWMESFLADRTDSKLRLVLSLYPTCRTSDADLQNVLRLVDRHGDRAAFKIYPEQFLDNRSSNLICFVNSDGRLAISAGPTENLGFAGAGPSQANVATPIADATFEACRRWFDGIWVIAGPLSNGIIATIPKLSLPEGDSDAAALWDSFRSNCLSQDGAGKPPRVLVNPVTGAATLVDDEGNPVATPTEEIGIPKLDPFTEKISRLFEQGMLVSVDKLSRIPPLEAPVKPEWFGVESFRQTGVVRSRTTMKVAPFDETTRRKVDRLRRVTGDLLPRFTFPLADGVRWMPRPAIPLFERALSAANLEAKQFLDLTIGDTVDSFLAAQRDRIRADAQRMYEAYHPRGKIPMSAVDQIVYELRARLGKTKTHKVLPRVAYSAVAFNPAQSSAWSSPWGQAFSLLKAIADFPREAATDPFFLQGARVDQDQLLDAMNVAGDALLAAERKGAPNKRRLKDELDLIRQLESAAGEPRGKCGALWSLITTGDESAIVAIVNASPLQGILAQIEPWPPGSSEP